MARTAYPVVVNGASANVIVATAVEIDKVRWVDATTAGHFVEITDANGNSKFKSVAPGGNYVESETFTTPIESSGIKVPTLDSGVLYIYILNQ